MTEITLKLTLEELKTLDKYVELNDETRPLFDKIRNAYPEPHPLFDVIRNLGYSVDCCYEIVDAIEEFEKSKEVKKLQEKEWKNVALEFGKKLPVILPHNYDELSPASWFRWVVFTYGKYMEQRDKESGYTPKLQERGELHKDVERVVKESVKWCEENPDKDPLDWLKPQSPEETERGLKEAFREAVKQGVVSSHTKPKTLSDLIYDWWGEVFTSGWDDETCIENLVDEISLWLPTEHETNSYKWNECIRTIREKLR